MSVALFSPEGASNEVIIVLIFLVVSRPFSFGTRANFKQYTK